MKQTFILLVLSLIAIAAFAEAKPKWHQLEKYNYKRFVSDFAKRYDDGEHEVRRAIFERNLQMIQKHNQDPTKTWKQGVNHMSDWTDEEFLQLLGYKKSVAYTSKRANQVQSFGEDISLEDLPKSIDWREHGAVTAVKDQGRCGSCWSFGTAETVESHWAIATGQLFDLSQQQILDCTPNPQHCGGSGGCQGGTSEIAYERIIEMGGLSSEYTYPYTSYFGQDSQCHFNATKTKPFAILKGYQVLPSNEYAPVMKAVATLGPMAVAVDASSWKNYESGVYDGCNQTNPDIDHAVQLVGYGTDEQFGDYWLVRNSWTPTWGEKGYIRLRRTGTARCGLDITPADGLGCDGGPASVTACGTCAILYDVSYPIVASTRN